MWARYSSYWSVLIIFNFHPHSPGGHGGHIWDNFQRKSLFLTVSSNTQTLYQSQITIDQLYGLELGFPCPFQWFFMFVHIDQGFTGVKKGSNFIEYYPFWPIFMQISTFLILKSLTTDITDWILMLFNTFNNCIAEYSLLCLHRVTYESNFTGNYQNYGICKHFVKFFK